MIPILKTVKKRIICVLSRATYGKHVQQQRIFDRVCVRMSAIFSNLGCFVANRMRYMALYRSNRDLCALIDRIWVFTGVCNEHLLVTQASYITTCNNNMI